MAMKRCIGRLAGHGAVVARSALVAAAAVIVLALSGCTYYVPAPGTVVPGAPASFDRSFSAAAGAMRDQGLAISVEDRSSGTIIGKAQTGTVTASVRQQADGSVRVQFDATGLRDTDLINRVSRGYDQRMGR
jgi:hypothetical protein